MIAVLLATTLVAAAPQTEGQSQPEPARTESDAWSIEHLPLPEGCVLEVGGMDFLPDGRLVVSTRRGQVWIVENPLADDVADIQVKLFHEGLWEGLGLDVKDGEIHVLQRGELSKLEDTDGDGRCDRLTTVADDWGVSGHYHEFAFGLPRASDDHWFMGLNVSFGDPEWWHGRSTVPYRGWIMRVSPDGQVEPWAHGVRSPNGVAVDSRDRVFVTDNQGDWVASSPIYLIEKGAFYGHPKPLNWTESYRAAGKVADDEIPPAEAATARRPPAIWIPYKWSRSTGNLLEDQSRGKFGIPQGQFIVAELTNGMLLRASFEEVQGQTQGWVTPLVQEIGSVNRVVQAPDGSVFCGLTNRGWGGRAPADGLARVRFTGRTPMEIFGMSIADVPDFDGGASEDEADAYGFDLVLSEPIHGDWEASAENVEVLQYDYNYWWEYGSPEQHKETLEVGSVTISEDRTRVTVRCPDLLPAMCVRITMKGVTGAAGNPLVHPEISYTINQFPSGPATNAYVSKLVPPPPSKGDVGAGMLHLSWGDALAQFESEGWEVVDAVLDGDDPTAFKTSPGNGAIVQKELSVLTSKAAFGDAYTHVEVMLAGAGTAYINVGDIARIAISQNDKELNGSVNDQPPIAQVALNPGDWSKIEVWTRLATPDSPAFVDRLVINGVTVQEGLEIAGTSGQSGKLGLTTLGRTAAFRNIQVKPMDRPDDGDLPWEFLDPEANWDDWGGSGDAIFDLTGEGIDCRGALGYLWLPIDDFEDGVLRFKAKTNSNGAGALILRANEDEDGAVTGYAVRLNTSFPDGNLTGSLRGGGQESPVTTELIATDAWTDVEVRVATEDGSTTVEVLLNGVTVNRMTDDEPLEAGAIALRVDHEGTIMLVNDLRVAR